MPKKNNQKLKVLCICLKYVLYTNMLALFPSFFLLFVTKRSSSCNHTVIHELISSLQKL